MCPAKNRKCLIYNFKCLDEFILCPARHKTYLSCFIFQISILSKENILLIFFNYTHLITESLTSKTSLFIEKTNANHFFVSTLITKISTSLTKIIVCSMKISVCPVRFCVCHTRIIVCLTKLSV